MRPPSPPPPQSSSQTNTKQNTKSKKPITGSGMLSESSSTCSALHNRRVTEPIDPFDVLSQAFNERQPNVMVKCEMLEKENSEIKATMARILAIVMHIFGEKPNLCLIGGTTTSSNYSHNNDCSP